MYRCCPEMPALRRMLETGEPGIAKKRPDRRWMACPVKKQRRAQGAKGV